MGEYEPDPDMLAAYAADSGCSAPSQLQEEGAEGHDVPQRSYKEEGASEWVRYITQRNYKKRVQRDTMSFAQLRLGVITAISYEY